MFKVGFNRVLFTQTIIAMKIKTIFCWLLLCLPLFVFSQDQAPVSNGFGLGFQLNQYQRDFGIGLTASSPHFFNNRMALRYRGNLMWHEYVQEGETSWSPYFSSTLGLTGGCGILHEFLRLYGEGGLLLLFPNDNISTQKTVIGGYGLFGFEFYMSAHNSYFLEIGGVGTGATADRLPNRPVYSNGLSLSVGYRVVF